MNGTIPNKAKGISMAIHNKYRKVAGSLEEKISVLLWRIMGNVSMLIIRNEIQEKRIRAILNQVYR